MFSFFLALKYLKPKRGIVSVVTLLSVLGVTIGVAIVIIVRAVFTGFSDTWQKKLLEFKPHVVVQSGSRQELLVDYDKLCERFEQIPGVVVASPSIEGRVLVEHAKLIVAPILLGVDPDRFQRQVPLEIWNGSFDLSGEGVAIGIDMATRLRANVGDELLVYSPMNLVDKDELYLPERLTIRAIYKTGQAEYDNSFIFTSLAVARDLMGYTGGVTSVSLRVEEPHALQPYSSDPENLISRIRTAGREFYGRPISVSTWQQQDRLIFNAVATEKNMMTLLLIFISVVAIFCVVNTIIVITVQKTNEIGLLKALGFSSGQLTTAFVLYGWIQCVVGTLLGIGLSFLILFNLQNLVDMLGTYFGLDVFPKAVYGLDAIPWRVEPVEILQVVVMVVAFCAVASLLPAWRAASMDPVDALRKE